MAMKIPDPLAERLFGQALWTHSRFLQQPKYAVNSDAASKERLG
jgi:hypothetical protein